MEKEKKNKKKVAMLIVLAAILLICCAGVAAAVKTASGKSKPVIVATAGDAQAVTEQMEAAGEQKNDVRSDVTENRDEEKKDAVGADSKKDTADESSGKKDSTSSQTANSGSNKKDSTGSQTANSVSNKKDSADSQTTNSNTSGNSGKKDSTGSQTANTGSSNNQTNNKPDTTQQATTEAEVKAVWVVDQAAYDEERPVYETKCRWICVNCGGYMYNQSDIDNHPCVSSWYSDTYDEQVGTETIHHDEVGHWEYR